jgi:uncharacterized protein YjiS (DUF1127 family)
METAMTTHIPVLPVAAGTLLRAFLSLLALVTLWVKNVQRARRHRREAMALAGLDQNILADIGLNRSDLSDAFATPFWEDPTLLLRERAIERRVNRPTLRAARIDADGFHRPPTDRPARQAY